MLDVVLAVSAEQRLADLGIQYDKRDLRHMQRNMADKLAVIMNPGCTEQLAKSYLREAHSAIKSQTSHSIGLHHGVFFRR